MRWRSTIQLRLTMALAVALATALGAENAAAQKTLSPSETAVSFYKALKAKRYAEGFRLSVYNGAIEGLSPDELKELEPDFARTFSGIPDRIDAVSEHIDGDSATVSLKFEGTDENQPVMLVRVGGRWLVGDMDALRLVQSQGREFFFNARMSVNESESAQMIYRIIGAETIYARQKQGVYASLDQLIQLGGIPKDWEGGTANGYRATVTIASDRKSFFVTAEPVQYGKTGKLSFYADINNLRAEDLKGKPAGPDSPVYTIK